MTLVYQLPPIPMTSFPWAVLDYIPIPIYFPKYNPNSPHFYFHWNKKSLKKTLIVVGLHGEEWFSLEWAHKIIHYYSTVSHSTH